MVSVQHEHSEQDREVDDQLENDAHYRRHKWRFYIPRSWEERLVLEEPPPQLTGLQHPPKMEATLITNRVGRKLSVKDRTLYMQNHVADDYWELARRIDRKEVDIQFKYVFVQIGLDWCLKAKKTMVREAVSRLLYAVARNNGRARLGLIGITPRFSLGLETKRFTVNFNRNVASAVREFAHRYRVQFLPLHLHFLNREDNSPIQPVSRYFDEEDRYKLAGGLVLRENIFKEIGLIPLNGMF